MEHNQTYIQKAKQKTNKIEEELITLKNFINPEPQNENNDDFYLFSTQTEIGINIKESIDEITKNISRLYEKINDLNTYTKEYFNNRQ